MWRFLRILVLIIYRLEKFTKHNKTYYNRILPFISLYLGLTIFIWLNPEYLGVWLLLVFLRISLTPLDKELPPCLENFVGNIVFWFWEITMQFQLHYLLKLLLELLLGGRRDFYNEYYCSYNQKFWISYI